MWASTFDIIFRRKLHLFADEINVFFKLRNCHRRPKWSERNHFHIHVFHVWNIWILVLYSITIPLDYFSYTFPFFDPMHNLFLVVVILAIFFICVVDSQQNPRSSLAAAQAKLEALSARVGKKAEPEKPKTNEIKSATRKSKKSGRR